MRLYVKLAAMILLFVALARFHAGIMLLGVACAAFLLLIGTMYGMRAVKVALMALPVVVCIDLSQHLRADDFEGTIPRRGDSTAVVDAKFAKMRETAHRWNDSLVLRAFAPHVDDDPSWVNYLGHHVTDVVDTKVVKDTSANSDSDESDGSDPSAQPN